MRRLCTRYWPKQSVRPQHGSAAGIGEDGHDTLGFARHSIPTHEAGHRLNPGPLGNVGIGVPFGLGAKAAKPDHQVVVISGDSAFGWLGMTIDSCCRHDLPILVVICNNGGITTRSEHGSLMPGQHLGYADYQLVCQAFGGHGERVEQAKEIRPAHPTFWLDLYGLGSPGCPGW